MTPRFQRPLSSAQAGIWLGQQMNAASPMYNAAECIELRGTLDIACFEQALRDVIDNTLVLNLIYKQVADEPVQILDKAPWKLIHKDYSNFDAPFEQARLWMLSDLASSVDLEQGPVFAQALIKLGNNHYCWYQRIHHIACDGFGFSLLTQAVADRYSSLMNKTNASVVPLESRITLDAFERILKEDRQYQTSTAFTKDRTFWLQHLDNQQQVPSLTQSTAPMADNSIRSSCAMSAALFSQLQTNAHLLAVNWVDWLIAAVAYLVYSRTAANELTLGLPVMGRMGSASLRVPAIVMNITPLRIQLGAVNNFQQLITQVAQFNKAARPHQRYRYEQLRRDLNKIGSDQRLFGPVVNIMPFDRQLAFTGCQAQVHNLSAGPVEDISFSFVLTQDTDGNSTLRFDLDANPNRYRDAEILDIQKEFLTLLGQLNNNCVLPLTPDTRYLSWLEGKCFIPYNSLPTEKITSILASIYSNIQKTPNSTALQNGDQRLSYRQLGDQAANAAHAISKLNIASGSVIALALPRGDAAIICALACLLADCTFVFIDPDAPAIRNRLILIDAKPALMVIENMTHSLNASVNTGQPTLRLATPDYLLAPDSQQSDALWQAASRPRNPGEYASAYLIYTSGSTGTPKGVIISHKALREFVDSTDSAYGINTNDHVLQFAPLHFDACIEEIFVTLARGARLVIRNQSMLESIPRFLAQCAEWKISVLDLPTAFWHEMAYACTNAKLELPPRLRLIIIGGEAVMPERVHQWRAAFGQGVDLFNTYGPSEATVIATYTNLAKPEATISIGQPLDGRAIAVVNSQMQILPKGAEGELLLLGGGLGDGYSGLPEKTAEQFINVRFPWLMHPQRVYRTGDRVKINSENYIEFIGRLDDQIKISGYRIDPLEVEAAIISLGYVKEAAVIVATNKGIKYLVAHIVSNKIPDAAQLRASLESLLPAPMLPSVLVNHERLPKNSSGKVDRKYLATLATTETPVVNSHSFTPEQQSIVDIWSAALGQTNIQLHDDFFALGGQSLQTIQVANRLSNILGREVPVALLFKHPTVASLAEVLFIDAPVKQQDVHATLLADCLEFEISLPVRKNDKFLLANKAPSSILLTGATGFVGAHLLAQLLMQTNASVICAVRAASQSIAYQRLQQSLTQQELLDTALATQFDARVQVVLVDLEQPHLGLGEQRFSHLGDSIDVIIHNAAITSVMRDYQSLRAANALATGELLKLAATRAISFHLISTIAVAPPANQATILEEDFVNIHSGLHDGYQQSKWVSEQMASIAHKKGYDVNVYRLARVTGAESSGYINPKDLVWSILRSGLRHEVLPDLDISEPWTPVDLVSQFIVQQILKPDRQGVFNITPDKNIQLTRIYGWLAEQGLEFSTLPLDQWCAQLKRFGSEEDKAIVSFFEQRKIPDTSTNNTQEKKQLHMVPIANKKFKQHAQPSGIDFPPIDQVLFNRYLNYAITQGLLPASAINKEIASHE